MKRPLTQSQKRELKKQAHHLKPVVIIGQHGLADSVMRELESTLEHHELIKIRINAADREERAQMLEQILRQTGAESIQTIGHVAVIYRPSADSSS